MKYFRNDPLRETGAYCDPQIDSYSANLTLGTPPQELRVRIDTGCSDLWVNTISSRLCRLRVDPCSDSGTYQANSSSTYNFVSDDFNVTYVDGTAALGDYVKDTLNIGGESLKDFQFGVGYRSGSPSGILGIGYTQNEAQTNNLGQRPYANLPQAMVDANLIKSNAYSLWLDDLQSSTGSILFGGVDTDKYIGSLQTLPVTKVQGGYSELIISLSRMSISQNGNNQSFTSDLPSAAILDSGSTISYLPDDLTTDLYRALNVQYSQREGSGFCSCDLASENITVDFTFSSPSVSVPINELVINPDQDLSQEDLSLKKRQSNSGNQDLCLFGISPSGGNMALLGDTFLRSAYVVYDLANNEISLAQTNFNATTSNIKEMGTGSRSVADATHVSNHVQATPTAAGGARVGDPLSSSSATSGSVSLQFDRDLSLLWLLSIADGFLGGMSLFFCI